MNEPLHVLITREPFLEWFVLTLDDGSSYELDPEETRAWFKERGANMDVVEKALDDCWNFYKAEFVIQNPKKPQLVNPRLEPKL